MKRWIRIWAALTAIWAVIVAAFCAFLLLLVPDEIGDLEIFSRLSPESAGFYDMQPDGEPGPHYQVSVLHDDGSLTGFRYPILDDEELQTIANDITDLPPELGNVSNQEINRFVEEVARRNEQAIAAEREVEEIIAAFPAEQQARRRTMIRTAVMLIVLPSVAVLLGGLLFRWVSDGFKPEGR